MNTQINLNSIELKETLKKLNKENGYWSILLTDNTGLPIIHSYDDNDDAETTAAMVSKIQQSISQVKDYVSTNNLMEISMMDDTGKRIVIRSFATNSSAMFLVFIIPNRSIPYKRTMKQLLHTIKTDWTL